MARPIFARIDTGAFRHNYLLAKRHAPQSLAWCVLKANAYGHGLLPCAEAVRDVADGFAVLDIADARKLRDAGFHHPVLLLEGLFESGELEESSSLSLSLVVHCLHQVEMLETAFLTKPVEVFLKINTGMNRLGFSTTEVGDVVERLRGNKNISQVIAMTHFACADGEGVAAQWERFTTVSAGMSFSASNSAALLRFPQTHGAWVRPGIMLYGASPMPGLKSAAEIGLEPVMTLTSEIIAVQSLRVGERVGYGGTFTADEVMRVGVVACGYADGYPRHAPTGTPILVDGAKTRTLGRVSMDMLACDLTHLPDTDIGSNVTLWGAALPADDVAGAAGTISYELFCALAARVPVIFD